MWFSVFFSAPPKDLYLGAFGTWNQEMSAKELLDQRKVDKCHCLIIPKSWLLGQISPQNHRTGNLSSWDNCSKTSLLIARGLVEKVVLANNSYLSIIHPCHILYPYYITYLYLYIYILFLIFIPFNSIPLIGSGDDRWLRKWTISHEMFHKKHDSFLSSRHSCSSIPMKPQLSQGISPWNQPFWWFISCILWANYGQLPIRSSYKS